MYQGIGTASNYERIIIEIGSGDGRLLTNLANLYDKENILLIGIEIDQHQYTSSCTRIKGREKNNRIQFVNGSFENVLAGFQDNTIDTVISVLPHPNYIDRANQDTWIPIYKTMLAKMKAHGDFILVTEIIDELLQPVSPAIYRSWKAWLVEALSSIGFSLLAFIDDGAPSCFSSHYLDKFMDDPERIRIITLVLTKKCSVE
jgi:phospholipid N-methyltransferase